MRSHRSVIASLIALAAATATPARADDAPAAETHAAAERPRVVGLHLGLSPSLDLDIAAGMFYGFANANIVLPLATDGELMAFGVGAGVRLPVTAGSRWSLQIFAHVNPMIMDQHEAWVGMGVGLGLEYLFQSGLTVGFKMPVLGYAVRASGSGYESSHTGEHVGMYYLASAAGLPLLSIGYRF